MNNQKVELIMPNNPDYLIIIEHAMYSFCQIMEFSEKETKGLAEGLINAVNNITNYVYNKGEEATYKVIFEQQTLGLLVIIQDQGIPFDPTMPEIKDLDETKNIRDKTNLGHLLDELPFDEVSFHNKGKEGMETHLFKYQDQHIHHLINKSELKKTIPTGSSTEKPINYTIRQMKPEEAVEVSKLAYYSYGYTYINDDIYFPDRLRELNRKKDFISYIAVMDDW